MCTADDKAVWITCYLLFSLLGMESTRLPPIFWDSRNELFSSNYSEGADVNPNGRTVTARIRDTVDVHCPLYSDIVGGDETEFSIIHMVTEFGYNNCVLDHAKALIQCVSPFTETVAKLTIREFTPLPNGLEFKPGETYYFISTSTGSFDGLHNAQGGLCQTKNMKLKLHISDQPTHGEAKVAETMTTGESRDTAVQPSVHDELGEVAAHRRNQLTDGAMADDDVMEAKQEPADSWQNTVGAKVRFDAAAHRRNFESARLGSFANEIFGQYDDGYVFKKRPLFLPYVASTRKPTLFVPTESGPVDHLVLYEVHEAHDFELTNHLREQKSLAFDRFSSFYAAYFVATCLLMLQRLL